MQIYSGHRELQSGFSLTQYFFRGNYINTLLCIVILCIREDTQSPLTKSKKKIEKVFNSYTGGAESVERAESIERTFEMPDKLGSNKKI